MKIALRPSHFATAFASAALLLATPVFAQNADNSLVQERMNRLENDIMLLQKQVARGEVPENGGGEPIANAAQLEVRLSAIDEQMRQLRGLVEQAENNTRRLTERLDNFQKDAEFRFQELSGKGHGGTPLPTAGAPAAATPAPAPAPTEAAPPPPEAAATPPAQQSSVKSAFKTPRDHYNYAFRLLNQTQYEQSAEAFRTFTEQYPKDPLVGNAYYWQGETYYIRRDYVAAADLFRQGFEVMPEGPKAADNLYKLALSLNALDRKQEACVVLQQVISRFKKTATNVVSKAEQELKKGNCKKA